MELTIKHLAAYLPYGLKVQHIEPMSFLKQKIRIELLEGVSDECCTFKSSCDWYFDSEENYCDIKPILYPLEYLTKEITHNGEIFIPIERISEYYGYEITKGEPINMMPYIVVQQLLEWKLDVFNLIENNLAIAVTEDFNPYK